MPSPIDTGGFLVPPPKDSKEASEHPELPRSDRELAEKVSRHYSIDLPNNRELIDALEKSIKNMDAEDKHSLERWMNEIDLHDTFLEPGRYTTAPDEKILAQHMRQRFRAANAMYELILDHTTKELAKMKTADGKAVAVNTSAFRTIDADLPDRLRIENKVDAIENRLSDSEKIPTGQEIGESIAFLQTILERGIDTAEDKVGATRARVQYLLASVESLKNLNRVAINRRRLLDSEGGRLLVEHGALNPDGSLPPAVWKQGAEPLRDPVALGFRTVILVASTLYTALLGISFLQKKERSVLDATWISASGYIALKAAGAFPKRLDEMNMIQLAENKMGLSDLSPQFRSGILEPASMAQLLMSQESRDMYERMGGRAIAADCAEEIKDALIDGKQKDALSKALRNKSITNTFLAEFAGEDSALAKSLTLLSMDDRVRFFNAMENPLSSSYREQWFAAVDTVLRHPPV